MRKGAMAHSATRVPATVVDEAGGTVAEHYARYICALRCDSLPGHVVRLAKYCLIDAIGCAIFGKRFPWSQIVLDQALASGSKGPCTIPGVASARLDPSKAALVLGAMAHAFELDSLAKPGVGVHPGATVALPALAMAQAQDAGGRDLIAAIVAGCEIMFRIGAATLHSPENIGFHAPGITGVFGAAAAGAALMKLPPRAIANAFGIAGSMGTGLLAFAKSGSGGMVKRLHLGRAGESGITAAQLASRGYEGPLAIFEGPYGVLDAYCPEHEPGLLMKGLGESFEIEHVCFKRYACHVTAHAPVQLLRGWIEQHGFSGNDIASIDLEMSEKVASTHSNADPGDIMLAQYSVPFATAIAAFHDPNDPRVFSDDVLKDPRVRQLAGRIVLRQQPGLAKGWGGTMRIRLANGEALSGELNSFLGTPETPFTEDGLKAKFERLVQDEAPHLKSTLFADLMRLEQFERISELVLT
jgi:2-methylcitrate dehydratase PrpD